MSMLPANSGADPNSPNIRVLMVEDNPADARLLREAVREVEGSHIHLTHADTLTRALSLLDQQTFDIVMLDLSLPDADGLDTLMRTHNRAPSVPIVVLTGLNDEALAMRAVREGAQDYLVKGQVTGHLLVRAMRYATERKRAIEALQRSEEYYRSLIENALDIITVIDGNGNIRYGSPSFERTLGYPQGVLTGTDAFALVHPEDEAQVREMLDTGTRHPGAAQHFECRIRHRNGTWRVFEAIGKRFEEHTSVNGYVLNSRDITERKRAEEELRQANETLHAVFEASPLAIYVLDLEGKVRVWNTAAEQMFGYAAEEVAGKPMPIVFEDDGGTFRTRLSQARSGQLVAGLEQHAHRKDGSQVSVSIWNARMRDASGTVTGIVEAVADNSERRRLEDQFRQVQKMEAVGRLAGGVAHDFNNLLTVISGYCHMLLDQLGTDHPMAEDMEQVLKAADRATSLTRQLLAFSRKQMVQPKVVDPDALLADTQAMLRRLLGEDIGLEYDLKAATRVRVDPGSFGQVVINLAVNARDAMPTGGTLRLNSRTVEITPDAGGPFATFDLGEYYLLEVTDNGTGMAEETLNHLFEPFFTTKERGRGTGLGLSTSYGIIKQNKGEIFVRSRLGEGSTFSIYLPTVTDPLEALDTRSPQRFYGGAETILVAEDEDGVRTVLSEMLRKLGYAVLAASSGEEAEQIAASSSSRIAMLVTDVIMPGMNGRELADRLRASRPGLKVLYVSGYAESGIVHEGVIEAGTAFLHKPFSQDELARKVREILDAREGTSEAPGQGTKLPSNPL
jgi:PAS domain S-box-containing protein